MCFRHSDLFQLNPADIQDSTGTFSIAQDEPHCLNEKRKKKKKKMKMKMTMKMRTKIKR